METIKGKALLMAADLGSMTAAAEALGYTVRYYPYDFFFGRGNLVSAAQPRQGGS